ncbi:MAG: hypothetical protein QXL57_07300 [Candidatus Bathyarchaeia archaeon]
MAEKYGDISKELKEFRKMVKEFLEAFLTEYQKKNNNIMIYKDIIIL